VEWPEEIDMRRAQEAKEQAEERMRQKQSYQEYMQNQIALARAMVRLRVGRRNRNLD
jgi:F-type H+-transporting ATPase subunit epsilon